MKALVSFLGNSLKFHCYFTIIVCISLETGGLPRERNPFNLQFDHIDSSLCFNKQNKYDFWIFTNGNKRSNNYAVFFTYLFIAWGKIF